MKNSEFKFLGYRITRIDSVIKDEFGNSEESLSNDIKIETIKANEEQNIYKVALNIEITSDTGNFRFFVRIVGDFQPSNEIAPDLLEKMLNQNAPAILFPFARSIITSYTAQANIPPIILPTINFVR